MELQTNTIKEIKRLKIIPEFEKSAFTIINHLQNSKNLLLVTHTNPDGDAIGSCLGLYHYLTQKNKNVTFILQSPIPTNLQFLNGIDKIHFLLNQNNFKISPDFDTIVLLDLNDISRLKTLRDEIELSKATKIVIDHHQEPKDFADYYLIDTTASSTGEILFKLLRKDCSINWTKEICENLYVAIMTDTGNFRFERTDGEVHRIVAELIDYGADPVKLYNEVYNKIPFNAAKLMGLGYSKLESYYGGKLVVMPIRHKDFLETNTQEEDTEGFVESLLSIDGVVMSILIMEVVERNEIRVSIRSKGDYSARNLALNFGGGGHINAAGCRFQNADFEVTKQKLVDKASEILN
ncbi:bifunctional oligoribonuclease/PAP phosphatase NrnA [Bacteroidetes/Chlorobi group bacterium MS-B_bin-24]|jgi:phosphoesterase RecJ-like protein|nr:MAG: bifunctional oligoribonuclease/PAP phosphatase NrnA [Bacteroidetes/Chlorobi group bacterium MS-B_bin-24]